ncbi:pyridoxal-phosphate-dependent aminotransferase family protein [Candidatus Bipolaricaulota bacterium]
MTLDTYRLMIPGPIQLVPEVLAEMSRPIVPHYGTEWTRFHKETLELLKPIFRTQGTIFAIPGSGSAGLEAALRTTLGPDRRLLVLSNGFFGERVAAIAESLHSNVVVKKLPVDRPISAADLRCAINGSNTLTAVAVVHSESSSGLLNPIRDLAAVCREQDLLFLVDAISSLGGIELAMDDWGVDLCIAASQKCLEGPPGLGLVAVGKRVWSRVSGEPPGGWYLDLHVWKRYAEEWSDWHPFPVTMAVPAFRSLRKGIDRILEEGLECRISRHMESAHYARTAFRELGFDPVFTDEVASPTILAIRGHADVGADEVVSRLKAEHRILVARGMGRFAGEAFRVGNMGPQATRSEMEPVIDAIGKLIPHESGEEKAQ